MAGQINQRSDANLMSIDLKTAGSIIYRLTRSQVQTAVRIHFDGLHRSTVSFREIITTLRGIFGKITEKDVFARSVTSRKNSIAPSPDGWYFIIIPTGVSLVGKIFCDRIKRRKITVRRVNLETVLKCILDGKALMFVEGMQRLSHHSEKITQTESVDVPEPCFGKQMKEGTSAPTLFSNNKSTIRSSSTTSLIACGSSCKKSGVLCPDMSISKMIPKICKDTRKEKVDSKKFPENSSKIDSRQPEEKKKKKSKSKESSSIRPIKSLISPAPDVSDCTRQVGFINMIREAQPNRRERKNRLRYEKVQKRSALALKRGSIVIAIEGVPCDLTFWDLRSRLVFEIFPLISTDNAIFLPCGSTKETRSREVRLFLDSPEHSQKILSLQGTLIRNSPINVKLIDLDQHITWLANNWDKIRIFN